MIWAIITTVYGAILMFIATPQRLSGYNGNYFSKQQLAMICNIFGLVTILFSAILWCSMEGVVNGLFHWSATLAITWAMLMLSQPKLAYLVGSCTLITSSSFIFSTMKMMVV